MGFLLISLAPTQEPTSVSLTSNHFESQPDPTREVYSKAAAGIQTEEESFFLKR